MFCSDLEVLTNRKFSQIQLEKSPRERPFNYTSLKRERVSESQTRETIAHWLFIILYLFQHFFLQAQFECVLNAHSPLEMKLLEMGLGNEKACRQCAKIRKTKNTLQEDQIRASSPLLTPGRL